MNSLSVSVNSLKQYCFLFFCVTYACQGRHQNLNWKQQESEDDSGQDGSETVGRHQEERKQLARDGNGKV